MGLNFRLKSSVSFVQFHVLLKLIALGRVAFILYIYCIDLLICEVLVQLFLAIVSLSCILCLLVTLSQEYSRCDHLYSLNFLTPD